MWTYWHYYLDGEIRQDETLIFINPLTLYILWLQVSYKINALFQGGET